MNKRQLISNLTRIGMAEKEAKLYIAMLEKPEITAGDLHRISGVPRSKTYDTLDKMLAKGYCQERVENTHRYFKAVQPSFLQGILKTRWEADLKALQDASREALGFLQSKYKRVQDTDPSRNLIEILRNLDHIRGKYLNLVNETKEEILTFNRSPYACADPKVLKAQNEAICNLRDRGVEARSIYMWEEGIFDWLGPAMESQIEAGEEVRLSEFLPIKMMVFDRKKVLLALSDIPAESQSDFTMVVVEDSGLIQSFIFLFETIWSQSKTPEDWSR
jgi:sugar-specific transcriptional regulator TrmB